jgi:hypothetical protein
MNEPQLGLVLLTPVILAFIAFMYRKGALPRVGAVAAALVTLIVAMAMFVGQS